MRYLTTLTRNIRKYLSDRGAELGDESRESMPFFIIVTIVLLGLYASALYGSPALRSPEKLIPFTLLIAAHISLYWAVGAIPVDLRWQAAYLFIQSMIAFAIALLTRNLTIIFGLFPALIGISVGVLHTWRQIAVAILGLLSLAAVSMVLVQGWDSLVQWAWVAVPVTLFVIVYVELYTRQGEARARSQALLSELEAAHLQLAEYAARVEDLTLAAERQRMARELHDTLAQGLAGLILQLEASNSHLEDGRPGRAKEIVQQALGRARETLADARRAIGDLRTTAEGGDTLEEVVQREVERFAEATGIPCDLVLELPGTLPDPLTEYVGRMVAESLANVAQHARAGQVSLRMVTDAEALRLTVCDDGRGFEPAAQGQAGHYGLVGMRERARLAGGTMKLDSAPGRGTSLSFVLPLKTSD